MSSQLLVVKMGGGYIKAILHEGASTVFSRDHAELLGRLKRIKVVETPDHPEKRNPR